MGLQQSQHTTQQPSPLSPLVNSVAVLLKWQTGGLLLLCVAFAAFLSMGNKKNKLVFGRVAGRTEKLNALKTASQQMKNRKHNKVTLYVGTPKSLGWSAKFNTFLGSRPSLYVPNAQEGVVVCGSPGKGKTFSVIDPLIRSSLDQGFPTIVYDFKGDQLRAHAAYAAALGYEVQVFAPGKPYSAVCNPLDFLEDKSDRSMAKQFAVILNRNTQENPGKSDEYFAKAGDLLVQAILLLAKGSPYDDLLMAWSLLSLPQLAKRLEAAKAEGNVSIWASIGAKSLISVAHAQETEGGIVSNAINTFADLISKDFVPCLCGQTTLPLDVTGKKLLVFQLDGRTRDVTAPLVATILHLIITRNMAVRRSEPLVLAMDEFPTLYLPDLVKWINEYRSNGLCTILGFQNYAQLEHRYGRERTTSIISAAAVKFFFNPQDEITAKRFCDYCGDEEVILKPRSRNHGKNSSTGESEQYNRKPLFDTQFFVTLPAGKCVFINPAYEGGERAALPQTLKIQLASPNPEQNC